MKDGFEFEATVAVTPHRTNLLVEYPEEVNSLTDHCSEYLADIRVEDDAIPKEPGLYRCHFRYWFNGDDIDPDYGLVLIGHRKVQIEGAK